jgi:hypothetical protein
MNILVLYYSRTYPLRATIVDHLYSFERHSGARCYYVNLGLPWIPAGLQDVEFDLVVFHTILLWDRVVPKQFGAHVERAAWVAGLSCPKVILPQDEYLHGDVLEQFIERFGVTHVMSAAQPDQWPLLYPGVDREKVHFETVLTGYLADATLERIARIVGRETPRTRDIGYRAQAPWPSWGRHGLAKIEVGTAVRLRASSAGLAVDISNDPADTFLGDAWYEFLTDCRFVLGVEGGASVLDYDGSIEACVSAFSAAHPSASFDEFEAACFPGKDGGIDYVAISPRHLEACATRTCQLLVEGRYNDILKPGVHYIEIKKDYSNLDEVLEAVKDEAGRRVMVDRAYRDVAECDDWRYEGFVRFVVGHAVAGAVPVQRPASALERRVLNVTRMRDRVLWPLWGVAWALRGVLSRILGRGNVDRWVRKAKQRLGEVE